MPDKKDFISIFKAGAEGRLAKLGKGIAELEKNPDNLELVKELKREAHNLKGASRVFGFHEIQDAAREIEDIFDRVSQKKIRFTAPIADGISKGLDAVRGSLGKITNDEKIDTCG